MFRSIGVFSKWQNRLPCEVRRRLLSAGDSVRERRIFSVEDVQTFAEVTGDYNPIHIDPVVAEKSKFERCIVHGALLNGLVSGLLGMKLPGPGSVLVHQYLEFCAPLFVGEEVIANVEITSVKRALVECAFTCEASARQKVVMKGYAKLMVINIEKSTNNPKIPPV